MLALWGKKKELVNIDHIENGVVYSYWRTGKYEGTLVLPLVIKGKNVEQFEILKYEQMKLI